MPSGHPSDRATAPGHDPMGSVKTFGIFSVVTDDSGSKCFEDKERLNSLCKQIHRTAEGQRTTAFHCTMYLLPLDHVSKNQLSTNQNL